jgi:glycosyltransferase involved in cell wall biosynthesis
MSSTQINFISNIREEDSGGGWNAMSYHLFKGLQARFDVHHSGGIDPPPLRFEHYASRGMRALGLKGSFFFFSERRLKAIGREVDGRRLPDAVLDFYHGTTPWVKAGRVRPYFCYADLVFPAYVNYYIGSERFSQRDLHRIMEQERSFLAGAEKVFFSSEWARIEALDYYPLDGAHVVNVGMGGSLTGEPSIDVHDPIQLLFVSMHFEAKGGHDAYRVFQELRRSHPAARMKIIGQRPPDWIADADGVEYLGSLDKNDPAELALFQETVARSTCLVHPTMKDATPLTLVECGSLGTPVLSSDRFGIPEMIDHGNSGYVVSDWSKVREIADQIAGIHGEIEWRQRTAEYYRSRFSWETVIDKIACELG